MSAARYLAWVPIAMWASIYPARMILAHRRFETNAYDLSVFDYALWNLADGGYVPIFGKSLFSDHAMPTLAVLWPAYSAYPDPQALIVVQAVALLSAALLLARLMRDRLSPLMLTAIVGAFLFSRRSHGAVMSTFYVESLEPLLVIAMVMAWEARRWTWFAICVGLALGCKEDMAIYIACFAVVMWSRGDRRPALATATVAAAWLAVALLVLIPASRQHDRLARDNPLWAERFPEATTGALARALSPAATIEFAQALASTGFVAVAAPQWLGVAAPGAFANFAAAPSLQQSGLTGHYFWPVMPWLFIAAAHGARWMERRNRKLASVFAVALLAFTAIDSPLWQRVTQKSAIGPAQLSAMRSALDTIPSSASVTAMPNLVPHLPHREVVHTFGINEPREATNYAALTSLGNLWPLSEAQVAARIACLDAAPMFERIGHGDPAIFRRIGDDRRWPGCATATSTGQSR